jgi:hypothetical protein
MLLLIFLNPHNQSVIANEWWSKKRKLNDNLIEEKQILMMEVEELHLERNGLQAEVNALQEENAKCIEANTDLTESLEDAIDTNLTLSLSLSEMRGGEKRGAPFISF